MKTVTIQIGNSDNKLKQREWSQFICDINALVSFAATQVHFFGGSSFYAEWQNVAWVAEVKTDNLPTLVEKIEAVRRQFKQKSVAVGQTTLV